MGHRVPVKPSSVRGIQNRAEQTEVLSRGAHRPEETGGNPEGSQNLSRVTGRKKQASQPVDVARPRCRPWSWLFGKAGSEHGNRVEAAPNGSCRPGEQSMVPGSLLGPDRGAPTPRPTGELTKAWSHLADDRGDCGQHGALE